MARVTKEALKDVPREPRSLRDRLPRPPRALRTLPVAGIGRSFLAGVVGYALIGTVLSAPTDWLAGVTLLAVLAIAYYGGLRDGRRDLAVSALTDRRDDRPAERPPERGEDSET